MAAQSLGSKRKKYDCPKRILSGIALPNCLESLLVARQRQLAMVAEVAFAPVGSEGRFGVAVAALAQLSYFACHLPAFKRVPQSTAQRALYDAAGSTRAQIDRRKTP